MSVRSEQWSGSGPPMTYRTPTMSTQREPETFLEHLSEWCGRHLNFYRVHVLAFVLTPLIFAAVFYASNGENQIMFIDALFMCTSAMTVTGLNSVLLGSLTAWQQAILFMLMCLGSTSGVSMVTIIIRRHFFRKRFKRMVETDPKARARVEAVEAREAAKRRELLHKAHLDTPLLTGAKHTPVGTPHPEGGPASRATTLPSTDASRTASAIDLPKDRRTAKERQREKERKREREKEKERERIRKHGIKANMVRRVDAPVRINAMSVGGFLDAPGDTSLPTPAPSPAQYSIAPTPEPLESEQADTAEGSSSGKHDDTTAPPASTPGVETTESEAHVSEPIPLVQEPEEVTPTAEEFKGHRERASDGGIRPISGEHRSLAVPRSVTMDPRFTADHVDRGDRMPRTATVEFREPQRGGDEGLRFRATRTQRTATRRQSSASIRSPGMPRTRTDREAMQRGFGGFPNPLAVAGSFGARMLKKAIPKSSTSMQRTTTLQSVHSTRDTVELERGMSRAVTYISFDAVVGRNSRFEHLTEAQQEELGGVEYRALGLLLKLVPIYWLGFQLISVLLIAPWLSVSHDFASVFTQAGINTTWFSFFQVSSAYTNCGMSLIDASMTVFQNAYLMIIVICILILAGNTAFPIFLRLMIWILSKLVRRSSQTRETLQFLLDHPRRCFIYLFPSYQTWFLLFSLVVLNCTDWVAFLVLDIGNPVLEAIPVGRRIIDGLLQSLAVRAAGFQIVSLSALAPAVQVLYVIMMYIAVYPIALSIRSSNVYEERSLGIFDDDDDDESDEEKLAQKGSAKSYIAFHARRQLAFDIWWLVFALWLICIVERHELEDPASISYFNIFAIMFEVTSAYGTVGLSLGLPYTNTSFSGSWRIISKLVLCAVMIRGRHRGLPIALDRAVLLPSDLEEVNDFRAPTRTSTEFVDEHGNKTQPGPLRRIMSMLPPVPGPAGHHHFHRRRKTSAESHDRPDPAAFAAPSTAPQPEVDRPESSSSDERKDNEVFESVSAKTE